MKSTLNILVMLFAILSTQAILASGDRVNNGGGLGEKNVIYAYEKIEKYIQLCLSADACKLTPLQRSILQKIKQGLPQDKHSEQVIFDSEKKNPGSFIIDGVVRIAKTGSQVGSPIVINSDLLYTKNTNGVYEAITMPEAIAVLVHEFGHHYGNFSHEELDLIGVRVSLMLQSKVIATPLVPWKTDISLVVINEDAAGAFPEILIYVGDEIIDISEQYKNEIKCVKFKIPIPLFPVPDIDVVSKMPKGSILHNLHWEKIKEDKNAMYVQITGNVSNRCKAKSDLEIRSNSSQITFKFRLHKNLNKIKDEWVYDPKSLRLDQYREQWWKIIKLPILPN